MSEDTAFRYLEGMDARQRRKVRRELARLILSEQVAVATAILSGALFAKEAP